MGKKEQDKPKSQKEEKENSAKKSTKTEDKSDKQKSTKKDSQPKQKPLTVGSIIKRFCFLSFLVVITAIGKRKRCILLNDYRIRRSHIFN